MWRRLPWPSSVARPGELADHRAREPASPIRNESPPAPWSVPPPFSLRRGGRTRSRRARARGRRARAPRGRPGTRRATARNSAEHRRQRGGLVVVGVVAAVGVERDAAQRQPHGRASRPARRGGAGTCRPGRSPAAPTPGCASRAARAAPAARSSGAPRCARRRARGRPSAARRARRSAGRGVRPMSHTSRVHSR